MPVTRQPGRRAAGNKSLTIAELFIKQTLNDYNIACKMWYNKIQCSHFPDVSELPANHRHGTDGSKKLRENTGQVSR